MTHEDYVSFEQAKNLKELGFDWEIEYFYGLNDANEPKLYRYPDILGGQDNHNKYHGSFSAPTLAQVQKWLREVKGIALNIIAHDGGFYQWESIFLPKAPVPVFIDYIVPDYYLYDTYEQALSAGLSLIIGLIKAEGK